MSGEQEFDRLLDQSSLGTPAARAYQALTPDRVHERLRTQLQRLLAADPEEGIDEVVLAQPQQTREDGAGMSYEQDKAAYVRSQFERLGESERYRIKVTSDEGETHWLGVDPDQLDRIKSILTGNDRHGVSAHFDADEIECLVRAAAEAACVGLDDLSSRQRELAETAFGLLDNHAE